MANDNNQIFSMASGDVLVWVEAGGAICIKVNTEFNDPADMSSDEALERWPLRSGAVRRRQDRQEGAGGAEKAHGLSDGLTSLRCYGDLVGCSVTGSI